MKCCPRETDFEIGIKAKWKLDEILVVLRLNNLKKTSFHPAN